MSTRPEYIPHEDRQRDSLESAEMSDEEVDEAVDALSGDFAPDEELQDDGFGDY